MTRRDIDETEVGIVVRNQTLMIMTFDDATVEYLCDVLAESLQRSYEVIDMFIERDYDDDEDVW